MKSKNNIEINKKSNNRIKIIIALIFVIAILVRVLYVLKIDSYKNQHDIHKENSYGGMTYFITLYKTNKLPDTNRGQMYHPPLHYIIGTMWMKVGSLFTDDIISLINSIKYLTLIYSIVTLFLFYKILKELHIKDKIKIYMLTAFSLMPTGIILAGTLNNDSLAYMLSIWSILRLIKWYKKSNFKNILILALIVGCTVMTKLSGALLAIPIAYIFIIKFIRVIIKANKITCKGKNAKEKKKKIVANICSKYISQYSFFGVISLSIGLWYSIRNLIKFKQPILYVLNINNPTLYRGNFSFAQRYLPELKEFMQMFAHPFDDHNIPAYVIKTFMLGEWKEWNAIPVLYYIALVSICILTIASLICMIASIYRKTKRYIEWRCAFGLLALFNFLSFFKMNRDLPYGCSMDFRYMVLTMFTGIMFIAFELAFLNIKNKKIANIIYTCIFIMTIISIIALNIIIISTPSANLTTY